MKGTMNHAKAKSERGQRRETRRNFDRKTGYNSLGAFRPCQHLGANAPQVGKGKERRKKNEDSINA